MSVQKIESGKRTRGARASRTTDSATLDQLARDQGTQPCADPGTYFGTWPGAMDDGFEDLIDTLRHPERHGAGSK